MLSRRRVVLVLGSAVVAPLSLQACAGKGDQAVTASEALLTQHGVLLRVLAIYRRAALALRINPGIVDAPALAQATDLFRTYGEDFHERALEEAYVFPRLKKAGGPMADMVTQLLQQHERGRVLIGFIHDRCSGVVVAPNQAEPVARALESMAGMYEAHAAFEDSVVYPAWRKLLDASEMKEMGQRFAGMQRGEFKTDSLQAVQARVAAIEHVMGVKDVSVYTPPPPQDSQSDASSAPAETGD